MNQPGIGSAALEISDLPEEVLPNIFKHLSTGERKAVKLVCKSWFAACNRLILTNYEVLNCLGIYQLSDINELLSRSERRFLNLKFDFVNFDIDLSLWEDNGPRIRSVAFKDCEFHNGIEKIIILCQNLFHLSFTYTTSFPYDRYRESNLLPFHDFEKISKNGIVCENVKSLKIDLRLRTLINLSDETMGRIFSIFPKVKILKIIYYGFGALDDFGTDFFDPYEGIELYFTITPVLNFLKMSAHQIEKLKLYFPLATLSSDELHSILETLTAMKRLEELSINLGSALKPRDIENLLNFKPFKSLVYSRWTSEEPVSLEPLLSSNLEHLEVLTPIDSSIATKSFLEKFKSSGLKSCKIIIKNSILIHDPESVASRYSTSKWSTTFPNLSVCIHRSGPREPPGEMVQFLQYFQNLQHLLIDDISYNELQSLLKYQTRLKSLIVKEEGQLKNLSQHRLDVFEDAFSQLTELEYLELSYSVAYIFLSSLSPASILANLKYLKISLLTYADNWIFPSDLLKLADATPFLEGLYVHDAGTIPFSVCVKLCTQLSRLRFLRWDRCQVNDAFCSDELFRNLFAMCPSLRLLFYTSVFEYIYFFDIINKKIVCYLQNDDSRKPYTFAKPRICGYTVNWLTFLQKFHCENKRFF